MMEYYTAFNLQLKEVKPIILIFCYLKPKYLELYGF